MPPTLPFQLLGRYDVIAEIGRGGHAVVYRARDRSLGRDVAVKMLREDVLAPDVRARFAQEVQVLARLQHAHILHVHDSGSFENLPFAVMELAPAMTLAHRLTSEPQLPLFDALQITREIAGALAYAHACGVLHRDVKPENILLGPGGAILADFGIARVTGDVALSRITSTGEAVGTLQYMSPEQLCAEPMDARSDQYSLACVLYEMLAGVRPHTAATLEGLRALRLTGRQPTVSVYRPTVPRALDELVQRAMAVTPADRFRSMDEFLMALDLSRTGDAPIVSAGYPRVTDSATAAVTPAAPNARRRRWPLPTLLALSVVGAAALWNNGWLLPTAEGNELSGELTVGLVPADDALADSVRLQLARELSAWNGVRVVSRGRATQQLALVVTPLTDSVQLRVTSRDGKGAAVNVSRIIARSAMSRADAAIAAIAREALSGRPASETPGIHGMPDRSLPALRAYVRGHALLRAGLLDSAAQVFRNVRDSLPSYAQAHFWAAQSAAWSAPQAVDRWRVDADEAVRTGTLHGVDSLLAVGLQRMANMDFLAACEAYGGATQIDPSSFPAWYGRGRCTQLDSLVIADGTTLRFRSGLSKVLPSFQQAVVTAPTSPLLAALYPPIMAASFARPAQTRTGHLPPGRRFYALPSLVGDSLAFTPVDSVRFVQGAPGSLPAQWVPAIRRGAAALTQLTALWTRRFPASSDAWYQRAISLELAGFLLREDSSSAEAALDSAARRSPAPILAVEIDVARVRLALRRGAIDSAVTLSRQVLAARRTPSGELPERLAALAALAADRASLRAALQHTYEDLPVGVRQPMRAWYAAALLGDCGALAGAQARVEAAVNGSYAEPERDAARRRILVPVLRLAVPCSGVESLQLYSPASTPLDSIYMALAASDFERARTLLAEVRRRRAGAPTATISWGRLYAESWVSVRIGDTVPAIAQIVAGLDDIALMSLNTLDDPEAAAGLRRALLLLRDLARSSTVSMAQRARRAAPPSSIDRWVAMSSAIPSP